MDSNLYVKNSGDIYLMVIVYVDDIIFAGNCENSCMEFAEQMQEKFEMSMQGELRYFLGLQIIQRDDAIVLTQEKYTKELIKRFEMEDAREVAIPIATGTKLSKGTDEKSVNQKEFRKLIGSLLYLTATRPDIVYAVTLCARYQSDPKESHLMAAKRILRYIKGTVNYGLHYGRTDGLALYGFTDADWAGDVDDRRSTSGGAFYLGSKCVAWHSRKQNSVTLSTTEAEYVAATHATTQMLWMRQQLADLKVEVELPLQLGCDNQSAINLTRNPVQHSRSKHIDIRYHFIKERVEDGELKLEYVPTKEQLADIFTKPLPKEAFQNLRLRLGVQPSLSHH